MVIETTSMSEKGNDAESLGLNILLMSAQGCVT